MRRNRRGQVTAELAVLFTFVIAGLLFMGIYLQRGSQGGVKGNIDAVGQQFSTMSAWSSHSESKQRQAGKTAGSTQCADYEHETAFTQDRTISRLTPCAPAGIPAGFEDPKGSVGSASTKINP